MIIKRITLVLLSFIVIFFVLGYRFVTSRPDLVSGYTGKDFYLKTPLIRMIDIEKLYILSDDSMEIQILTSQEKETRERYREPLLREKLYSLASEKDLLTGKRTIQTIDDARIFFRASTASYAGIPDEYSQKDKFFSWEGPFLFSADDLYVLSKTEVFTSKPKQHIDVDGFAIKSVRRWFIDPQLKPGQTIVVVGRCTGKTEILLPGSLKAKLPLLEDCYIGAGK